MGEIRKLLPITIIIGFIMTLISEFLPWFTIEAWDMNTSLWDVSADIQEDSARYVYLMLTVFGMLFGAGAFVIQGGMKRFLCIGAAFVTLATLAFTIYYYQDNTEEGITMGVGLIIALVSLFFVLLASAAGSLLGGED